MQIPHDSLIYLTEENETLATEIRRSLEREGYRVEHFSQLDDFAKACHTEMPDAVIMDATIKNDAGTGADLILKLKSQTISCPPIIFTSNCGDMESRLAATRSGASRFFLKPIDLENLTQTVNGLTENIIPEPFRVMLVDNCKADLKLHGDIIKKAGITVETISNPLTILERMKEFQPDILITEVNMPECSGHELIKIIRQDDTWAILPIIVLSSEERKSYHTKIMEAGGEGFLMKPIDPDHLIGTIVVRARRAKQTKRLNKDLKKVLRENKFQLATMDQHDIVSTADITGKITDVNDKFCKISGYTRDELVGQNHRLLKSNLHDKEFYDDLWATISGGNIWHGVICNRTKTGENYWVQSTIVPFLNERGKPYKYVSARTDITEVRKNEERLRRSQEFAKIGSWDWNIVTGKLLGTSSLWPLLGQEEQNIGSTIEKFLNVVHPDDHQKIRDKINLCLKTGTQFHMEHRVIWPDGSVHWLQENGNVVRDKYGDVTNMLGVVQDIDKRKRSELALMDREYQLQEAQSLAKIGNWQKNIATDKITWSDEIYRMIGREERNFELSNDFLHKVIHPDDLERVRESITTSERTGHKDITYRIIKPDGSIRHLHELTQAEKDAKDNVIVLKGTIQDITERVKSEQKLREIEERLSFAIEGAGDGIWDWNLPTGEMRFSTLYLKMLGYSEGELPFHQDSWSNNVHPDDLNRVQQVLKNYLEGWVDKYSMELRLCCKDGTYKWILCRGTIVERDSNENVIRMIGIHSDITERIEAENRIREIEEHNRTILHSVGEGIYGIDLEGKTTFINPSACEALGYSAAELIGQPMHQLIHHSYPDGSDYPEDNCFIYDSLESGNIHAISDEALWRKDGSSFPAEYASTPLLKNGQIAGVVVNFRDISERINAVKELFSAKEEAENANQAKTQFLSSMSHELRTPMNAIMGFGQLLTMESDNPLNASQTENVEEIVKAGHHLLDLINEVLDLAKVESGHVDMSIEPITLSEVISESLQLITPLAQKRGIEITTTHNDKELPFQKLSEIQDIVQADRVRLKQILINLLSNAVKYNIENGRITIACNETDDDRVILRVIDTGRGITPEQQSQLFKPFNRLDAENSGVEGTGIGLTITKKLAELMDSTIGLDSEVGKGTCFWVDLPKSAHHIPEEVSDNNGASDQGQPNYNLTTEHSILYIEDNPANLRLVTQLIGRMDNIHMWSAHEPMLGLELAQEHKPDLILLDINLPGMNGFDVLKQLRRREGTCNTPVIAISSNAMPNDIKKGLSAGFDDYITKPIDVGELVNTIKRCLLQND